MTGERRLADLVGATNLIPGPNSTELAIHLGWERGRGRGLVIAGVTFIVPAAVIVGVLAWVYVRYGDTPALDGVLYGVKPVVIAIIAQALWKLLPTVAKTPLLAALGAAAVAGYLLGVNAAAVGLMAAVSGRLATDAVVDVLTAAVVVGAALALWRTTWNSAWLIGAAR